MNMFWSALSSQFNFGYTRPYYPSWGSSGSGFGSSISSSFLGGAYASSGFAQTSSDDSLKGLLGLFSIFFLMNFRGERSHTVARHRPEPVEKTPPVPKMPPPPPSSPPPPPPTPGPTFSQETLTRVRKQSRRYDLDKDGALTVQEALGASNTLKAKNSNLSDLFARLSHEMKDRNANVDPNHDGKMTYRNVNGQAPELKRLARIAGARGRLEVADLTSV